VTALKDVDFELRYGEVHALMGENGAGKSTLMKILAGVQTQYQGAIQVEGRALSFGAVRNAEEAGVAMIHQELNLVPDLSVADNIFLGREPLIAGVLIDRRRIVRGAQRLLRHLGVDIDPERRVAELRIGEQQSVEIAKALSLDARILIMDEPTSALSSSECETLFKITRQLAGDGVAIIYTSHRIEEVLDLADRVTVLRDGRRVLTAPITELSRGTLISAMVGREMATSHRGTVAQVGATVLSVRNLTLDTLDRRGWRRTLHGVSFQLRRGEILGIGGLLGSGRTEILESIFGVARGWRGGDIAIDGAAVDIKSPADAYRLGVALVTEDRKERGLHLAASICDNVALPSIGAMSRFGLRAFARDRRWPMMSCENSRCAARASTRWSRRYPAATSRRSSSANGSPPSRRSCCSMSRLAASTSAPSRKSTRSSPGWPRRASRGLRTCSSGMLASVSQRWHLTCSQP
jgi:ribose transport system ATP-binding protein